MKTINYILGEEEFLKFRNLIYEEAGINLSDLKKALVQARLTRRLRHLDIPDFKTYFDYLQDNFSHEKTYFINAITTNKTEFFREYKHFEFLRDVFLPEFDKTGLREMRIWSAGCSSGEEPYSIAMFLDDYYKNTAAPRIKILATDIDTAVLDKATKGIYGEDIVQNVNTNMLKNFFYKGSGENKGLFKVKESMKRIITFRSLNLMNHPYPMKKQFHAIFCRNVIIYFDKPTQKNLFEGLFDYLDDNGYLFIGHSENITTLTDAYRLVGNTIYKKNLGEV